MSMPTAQLLERVICELQIAETQLLQQIYQHPSFTDLHTRWLACYRLAKQQAKHAQTPIKIRILPLSPAELDDDIRQPLEHTHLHHLLYTQEIDTPGGEPFTLLLYDDFIDPEILPTLNRILATSFCLLIADYNPESLGIRRWSDLNSIHIFDDQTIPEHTNIFFNLSQIHINALHHAVLKASSGYLLIDMLLHNIADSGWFFPANLFVTSNSIIQDHFPFTDYLSTRAFDHLQHNAVIKLQTESMGIAIRLADNNPLLLNLCAYRFAHYIKFIAREKIGCYLHKQDWCNHIKHWLLNYCGEQTIASPVPAYPLQGASITLEPLSHRHDIYRCDIGFSINTTNQRPTSISLHSEIRLQ